MMKFKKVFEGVSKTLKHQDSGLPADSSDVADKLLWISRGSEGPIDTHGSHVGYITTRGKETTNIKKHLKSHGWKSTPDDYGEGHIFHHENHNHLIHIAKDWPGTHLINIIHRDDFEDDKHRDILLDKSERKSLVDKTIDLSKPDNWLKIKMIQRKINR